MRDLECEILEWKQRGDARMEAAGDGTQRNFVQI